MITELRQKAPSRTFFVPAQSDSFSCRSSVLGNDGFPWYARCTIHLLETAGDLPSAKEGPMKRTAVLFMAGLTALLLSGPAVAADRSGGAQTTPAEKPGKLAMPHHAEGSVVSVDKSANTVVIKDTKGEQLNLVADNETAAQLNRLKAGDQVKVTYKKSKDQMVATKITLTESTRSSK